MRIGQVNKLVEIQGLEIYCRTFTKYPYTGNGEDSMAMVVASSHKDGHIHLLAPVDVSASLSVCMLYYLITNLLFIQVKYLLGASLSTTFVEISIPSLFKVQPLV